MHEEMVCFVVLLFMQLFLNGVIHFNLFKNLIYVLSLRTEFIFKYMRVQLILTSYFGTRLVTHVILI